MAPEVFLFHDRFDELSDFISQKMRMSHIYQPVMIMELLRKGRKASADEIAKAILLHDPSQAGYYRHEGPASLRLFSSRRERFRDTILPGFATGGWDAVAEHSLLASEASYI